MMHHSIRLRTSHFILTTAVCLMFLFAPLPVAPVLAGECIGVTCGSTSG